MKAHKSYKSKTDVGSNVKPPETDADYFTLTYQWFRSLTGLSL